MTDIEFKEWAKDKIFPFASDGIRTLDGAKRIALHSELIIEKQITMNLYTEEQVIRYAKDLKYLCAENAMKLPLTEDMYQAKLKQEISHTLLPPLPEPVQMPTEKERNEAAMEYGQNIDSDDLLTDDYHFVAGVKWLTNYINDEL